MADKPSREARAGSSNTIRARSTHRHRDTQDRQREPAEHARPPERTNQGSSRGERGTNRRGHSDHETKLRKKRTPQGQPSTQKSCPNPQKSRPKRQKEHHATRRKPARKPTTNGKRNDNDSTPNATPSPNQRRRQQPPKARAGNGTTTDTARQPGQERGKRRDGARAEGRDDPPKGEKDKQQPPYISNFLGWCVRACRRRQATKCAPPVGFLLRIGTVCKDRIVLCSNIELPQRKNEALVV